MLIVRLLQPVATNLKVGRHLVATNFLWNNGGTAFRRRSFRRCSRVVPDLPREVSGTTREWSQTSRRKVWGHSGVGIIHHRAFKPRVATGCNQSQNGSRLAGKGGSRKGASASVGEVPYGRNATL